MTTVTALEHKPCGLGEGILWHPLRQQLFWIDIVSKRLLSSENSSNLDISLDKTPSALGWVDENTLLLANEDGLNLFDIEHESLTLMVPFGHDTQHYRSNDGRADPWGGFWISTMHRDAKQGEAAFYRWYQGELRQVISNITIPNGCCFSQDKQWVYFTDSPTAQIMKMKLDKESGWPVSLPQVFVDHSENFREPDGAIVVDNGDVISAHWGASEVVRYSPEGDIVARYAMPVKQPTCPAFGGKNCDVLYISSAGVGVEDLSDQEGLTLKLTGVGKGCFEPAVVV